MKMNLKNIFTCNICKNKFEEKEIGIIGGDFFCQKDYLKGLEKFKIKNKIKYMGKSKSCIICGEPSTFINPKKCEKHLKL